MQKKSRKKRRPWVPEERLNLLDKNAPKSFFGAFYMLHVLHVYILHFTFGTCTRDVIVFPYRFSNTDCEAVELGTIILRIKGF